MLSPIKSLLTQAPDLESSWQVEKIAYSEADKRLDLHLGFRMGGKFTCPVYGRKRAPAYYTNQKSWQYMNFSQHRAYLHASEHRVERPDCELRRWHQINDLVEDLTFFGGIPVFAGMIRFLICNISNNSNAEFRLSLLQSTS